MPGRIPQSAPARNRPAGNATTQPRAGATVLYSVSKPKWRNGRRAGLKNRWEKIPCQFESDLRHHSLCGRGRADPTWNHRQAAAGAGGPLWEPAVRRKPLR